MELLEVDDLNFYPCTCGYQVNYIIWNLNLNSAPLIPRCLTNRFVGFVGIDLKQMEMDCVQHVENPILKIQLTLSRCQKTSNYFYFIQS
jgi:hypothetical protein